MLGWISFSASADPPTPAPDRPAVAPARTRLLKNEQAPFAGTLLSDAAMAAILTNADRGIKLLTLELARAGKELEVEKRKNEAICAVKVQGEKDRYQACVKDAERLRSSLEQSTNPPWYKSPYIHFIFGSAISAGVCAAASRIQ